MDQFLQRANEKRCPGYAVALDRNGDVIVTGVSRASDGDEDYATIKYSGAGVAIWTNRYDGPAGATAVAVDRKGNVIVTGSSIKDGSGYDFATIKYPASPRRC